MDNNDILIRLRYALDIKNTDMIEIFKLGGVSVTKEEVLKLLQKSKNNVEAKNNPVIDNLICDNFMLESFLNGLIGFKRGPQEESAQLEETTLPLKTTGNINNVLLKKLKIALALTSEDMLEIFKKAGIIITKGELSAILRKEGHRNYKECGDRYARNFLKGLTIKYRSK